MASRVHECEICNETYDGAEHKPLFVQCGHSFCRSCLLVLKSGKNTNCPTCRQPIASSVDQLPVVYALIPSVENLAADNPRAPVSDQCEMHGFCLDNFCATCGVLICMKCVVKSHLQHSVVAEEDLFNQNQPPTDFAVNLQSKNATNLECLTKALSGIDTIQNYIKNLDQCGEDVQQCKDTLLSMRTSVLEEIEVWQCDGIKSAEERRALFKMLPRQWKNDVQTLSNDLLFEIVKNQIKKLEETVENLQEILQEYSLAPSSLDLLFGAADTSELFVDDTAWFVYGNDDVRRALASVRENCRPSSLWVVSSATEPIRMLPQVLDVLGTASTGEISIKNMDSFWGSSTEDLRPFISKHGDKVVTFFGSYDEAVAVARAGGKNMVKLGIGFSETDDISLFPLNSSCFISLSFNGCLTPGEEINEKLLSWKPFALHFPDLLSGDHGSVIRLLSSCPSCEHLYLPRCHLPEDEMADLLKNCKENLMIRCQHIALSVEEQTRLNRLAKRSKLVLVWDIKLARL